MTRPEAERRLYEAARELVRQIANNDFVDSHGHQALRLRAYSETQRAIADVDALPADDGAPETPAEEIARLQREIGARQSRLQFLVLGDQRKSFHVPIGSPPDDGGRG